MLNKLTKMSTLSRFHNLSRYTTLLKKFNFMLMSAEVHTPDCYSFIAKVMSFHEIYRQRSTLQ